LIQKEQDQLASAVFPVGTPWKGAVSKACTFPCLRSFDRKRLVY
jgi:hypothetical protein